MDPEISSFGFDSCDQCKNINEGDYQLLFWLRKAIISLSALALIATLITIFRRKHHRLNSVRILIFLLFFYLLSLVSVLPHYSDMNLGLKAIRDEKCGVEQLISCFKQENKRSVMQWNQAQGVVNLASYSMAYWFGVCFLMYVRYQLENKRSLFKKWIKTGTICSILVTLIWYLIPVVFDFGITYMPTGYGILSSDYCLLYAGLVSANIGLATAWMVITPSIFLSFAIYLRLKIKMIEDKIRRQQQNNLSIKQYFLVRIRKFSLILGIVQFANVLKFLLFQITHSNILVFILNVGFDLLALWPIYIYLKYYDPTDPIDEQQPIVSIFSDEAERREGAESLVP